jgi:hypothetical protein
MCDLILSWIIQQLRKDKTIQELGEYVCKTRSIGNKLFRNHF